MERKWKEFAVGLAAGLCAAGLLAALLYWFALTQIG